MTPAPDITRLLQDLRSGDARAIDQLMPLLHDELRRLARSHLRRERPDHTLQPTALVHEAYLKLVGQSDASWENREQFFAVAAGMMRRILVDHARTRNRQKRGDGVIKVSLDESHEQVAASPAHDLVWLDEALEALARLDPRQARIVELRYFAGLSIRETAAALQISDATVGREWTTAKAWLFTRLREGRP